MSAALLLNLYANCTPPENATATSSYQTTVQHGHKQVLDDLFEDMFTQPDKEEEPEPVAKKCKVSTSTPILTEIRSFATAGYQ